MSTAPLDNLERRALEQRNELHETVAELKNKVEMTRERLTPSHLAREQFPRASWIISLVGFSLGYGFAGLFRRR
jgi:hypothetical protein